MEWINEPNQGNNTNNENTQPGDISPTGVGGIGGAIIACGVTGLLCDNLCAIYTGK